MKMQKEEEMKNKTNLKTLKDFRLYICEDHYKKGLWYRAVLKRELKAEAVKWVKEDRGLRLDNTIWRMNQDELLDLLEERWMKRLNITEEDLK